VKQTKSGPDPTSSKVSESPEHHRATGTLSGERQPEQRDPINDADKPADTGREPEPAEIMMRIWEFIRKPEHSNAIMAVFTVVIAFSSIGYGIVAWCQWSAMKDSNKINRDSLTSVQRAFVTFQGVQLDTPPVSMKPRTIAWVFSGVVENSGVTPAINKIEYFTGSNELRGEPSEEQFVGSEKDRPIGEIGPKVTKRVGQVIKQEDFVLGGFSLLQIGEEPFHKFLASHDVFVWGWVAYRDIFPTTPPHVTEFCEHMTGVMAINSPQGLVPKLQFSECRQHNCVDDHCSDYKTIADMVPR